MFKYNKTNVTSKSEEVSRYVEGNDIFNSELLRALDDPSINRVRYMITRFEYRPDLIAKEIYGSDSYCSILMHQLRMSLGDYKRGMVVRVIPKSDIDRILKSI